MAGHSLTYLRLAPSARGPTALLQASGHTYLDKAMALAPALALMCCLYWLIAGFLKAPLPAAVAAGHYRGAGGHS